jgi:hypothetical protein
MKIATHVLDSVDDTATVKLGVVCLTASSVL